jgi:hypothetical protein
MFTYRGKWYNRISSTGSLALGADNISEPSVTILDVHGVMCVFLRLKPWGTGVYLLVC